VGEEPTTHREAVKKDSWALTKLIGARKGKRLSPPKGLHAHPIGRHEKGDSSTVLRFREQSDL